jgi:hypothetical protein
MRGGDQTLLGQRRSTWAWLVTGSALIVLLVAATMTVWWALTRERQVATYRVLGSLTAIRLDLGNADAEIVGGRDAPVVDVRRTDHFAFGRPATNARSAAGGVLRIRSRCPDTLFGTCAARYRLTVPNNVPVTIRTGSGDVSLSGFRGSARITTEGGDIAADSYCGFVLQARADGGDIAASASCAPEQLDLRTRSGDIRAVVPPGRYRIDAETSAGTPSVRGLVPAEDAPFQIQALSGTGAIELAAGP